MLASSALLATPQRRGKADIVILCSVALILGVAALVAMTNEEEISHSLLLASYKWQGAGEAAAAAEITDATAEGIIPTVKQYTWTGAGEQSQADEIAAADTPVEQYDWTGAGEKAAQAELDNEGTKVEKYEWTGAGEKAAQAELDNEGTKVEKYKWQGKGEATMAKEMKDYADAFPPAEYKWQDYAITANNKEIKESNPVHYIDSPYFTQQ